jgi:hypothetical protein
VGMALGRAFIEVHADTRPFARELGPQIRGIVKDIEDSIDTNASKGIGDRVADSISEGIERNGDGISRSISRSVSKSRTRIKIDADVDVDRGRMARTIFRIGSAIQEGVTSSLNAVGDSVNSAADGLQKLVGGLLNVSSVSLPVAVALVGLAALFAPLLLSSVVALTAALANLIGLVPILISGLGVLLAAIFPVIIAFQGFGAALTAVFEKDPEKLAEALKNLTPAARGVVQELRKAMPFFTQLRKATQEAFFKPLAGVLTSVVAAVKGPLLIGFTAVADAAGRFLAAIISIGNTPGFIQFINQMFEGARTMFQILEGPMVGFLNALMNMMIAAMPFFLALINGFGNFLTRFSNWINESIKDGSFQAFLDKALMTLSDIWSLISALIELFAVMFAETEQGGRTFLQLVTEAIKDLTEFFKSPDGQRALKAMVDLAIIFGTMLIGAAQAAAFLLAQLERVADVIKWIVRNLNGVDIDKVRGGIPKPRGIVGAPFAEGGVISRPTLALMGEGFQPEAVIPLTNPQRAQEIADSTGLTAMLNGGGDTFIFYLGEEQIYARMVRVAHGALDTVGRQLADGTRLA